jgi:hypothetical protein
MEAASPQRPQGLPLLVLRAGGKPIHIEYNHIPETLTTVQRGCGLLAGRDGLNYLYPNCAALRCLSIRAVLQER